MSTFSDTVETPVKPSETDTPFKNFLEKLTPSLTPDKEPEHPKMFSVVMFNDPVTPGLSVMKAMIEVFEKTPEQAAEITYAIHRAGTGGKARVGVYSKDVAETKVSNAIQVIKSDAKLVAGRHYECDPQFSIEPE